MRGRRRRRASLTREEREQFAFLFDPLAKVNEDERPDLETLLSQLKADGVSLEVPKGAALGALGVSLFAQLAVDGSELVATREVNAAFVRNVAKFAKMQQRLRMTWSFLDAPALGVRPPAFLKLLDALCSALREASQTRRRIVEGLSARASKRRPRRELVPLPDGISRDDTRELRRAVSLVARSAPLGAPEIRYGMPRPCPQCGNPAPLLFSSETAATKGRSRRPPAP